MNLAPPLLLQEPHMQADVNPKPPGALQIPTHTLPQRHNLMLGCCDRIRQTPSQSTKVAISPFQPGLKCCLKCCHDPHLCCIVWLISVHSEHDDAVSDVRTRRVHRHLAQRTRQARICSGSPSLTERAKSEMRVGAGRPSLSGDRASDHRIIDHPGVAGPTCSPPQRQPYCNVTR